MERLCKRNKRYDYLSDIEYRKLEINAEISWNFKHIVNIKTIRGVRAITNLEGYKE